MRRKNYQKHSNKEFKPKRDLHEPVQLKPLEVKLDEANGNTTKLIKKFMKKVRKQEVLKPFYERLMYHVTKGQKRRQKKLKSEYEVKKNKKKQELKSLSQEEQFYQDIEKY
jgi:truncated hemoglobin YjbI